jgi:Ca2+-binding RTX toxin-like protein
MATIRVTNNAELSAALAGAQGGETIVLAAGNYTATIQGRSYASEVRLVSEDPGRPASFTYLDVTGSRNLSFESLRMDFRAAPGNPSYDNDFSVSGSRDIAFRGCVFDGALASGLGPAQDGYPTGYGLEVQGCNGITIEGCEFFDFLRGAQFVNSQNLILRGNEVHRMRADGLNLANVDGVVIEYNVFRDFFGNDLTKDHRDMIQFWTTGTTSPSTDILIRGNFFDSGDGIYTQSIFMRNQEVDSKGAGPAMYYQNVRIVDNLIYNGHHAGISVGETNGLLIDNNTILYNARNDSPTAPIPILSVAYMSTNVVVSDNVAPGLRASNPAFTLSNNVIVNVTNPAAANWYGRYFVNATAPDPTFADLQRLPGGLLEQAGAGSNTGHLVGLSWYGQGGGAGMAPNLPPAAADDVLNLVTGGAGTPMLLDVLANDGDPEGGALQVTAASSADFGSAVTVQGGQLHLATADVFHRGTIDYTVTDDRGASATATATVTVQRALPAVTMPGTSAGDRISGTGGADVIDGGLGADRVTAGRGNDVIFGGDGADSLLGSNGSDIISGGGGADCFSIAVRNVDPGDADTILDLDFGEGDELRLAGFASGTFAPGSHPGVLNGGATLAVDTLAELLALDGLPGLTLVFTGSPTADYVEFRLAITAGGLSQTVDLTLANTGIAQLDALGYSG